MRPSLIVWMLPCLLLAACVAPVQTDTKPSTYTSTTFVWHDANTIPTDPLAAPPFTSVFDAKRVLKPPQSITAGDSVHLPFEDPLAKTRLHQTGGSHSAPPIALWQGHQGKTEPGELQLQIDGYDFGDSSTSRWRQYFGLAQQRCKRKRLWDGHRPEWWICKSGCPRHTLSCYQRRSPPGRNRPAYWGGVLLDQRRGQSHLWCADQRNGCMLGLEQRWSGRTANGNNSSP